jgi:MYXO-CTERM domain-containing protein
MKTSRNWVASACGLLSVATCSMSVGAFSYEPWIDGPARTLSILSAEVNTQTGEVVINGIDNRAPGAPFTVSWGDGSTEDSFFELTHPYQDRGRNYLLQITAHYDDGTEDTIRTGIYFVAPQISPSTLPAQAAVTIPEANIELVTRMPYPLNPLTFMEDGCFGVIPRETFEYVMTVGATIELGLVDWDVQLDHGSFHQVLAKDPGLTGGMYSLWFTTPVAFAASCASMSTVADLPSMLHEMGHNVTLNFPADYYYGGKIDGDANAIYSETMAQIFAHAALYEMLNASGSYGLPAELMADLEQQAILSFGIVKQAYEEYLNQGARFSSWNDPATVDEDETLGTFMTIAYKFIEHAEDQQQGLGAPVLKLSRFLGQFGPDWHSQYSQDTNSPTAESFRATLLVAALGSALDTDLRQEFRALHFPVDDAVFDRLICPDCGQGGSGGGGGAGGLEPFVPAGTAGCVSYPGGSGALVAGAVGTGCGYHPPASAGSGVWAAGGSAGDANPPPPSGGSGPSAPVGGSAGGASPPPPSGGSGASAPVGGSTGGASPPPPLGGSGPSAPVGGGAAAAGGTSLDAGLGGAASPSNPPGTAGSGASTPGSGGAAAGRYAHAGSSAGITPAAGSAKGEGCSCRTAGAGSSRAWSASFAWLLAAAGLGLRARRRRAPRAYGALCSTIGPICTSG